MSKVEHLEAQLKQAKKLVALRDMALKLHSNREFQKVILEEFCTNDCARYVQESCDPALKPENRQDALNLAQAAGHLLRWLSIQIQIGNQAANEMLSLQETIDEVRAEPEEETEAGE